MTTVRSIGRFTYESPRTLKKALALLEENKGKARVLAGGTDLVLQMKIGRQSPDVIIDVKNVPDLNRVKWTKTGGLRIGAAVPLCDLLADPNIKKFKLLEQGCSVIGSVQIRNRATVGGNICNAAPSADSAPALLCLEASLVLASANGTRTVSIKDFFKGPGQTVVKNNEMLVEIVVPNVPENSSACYTRHTTREEMDIAVAAVASYIVVSPETKKVTKARIAMGAVAPTPALSTGAEAFLTGKTMTEANIKESAAIAARDCTPISDLRGGADYRRELVRVLTRRTLRKCCEALEIKI